MSREYAIKVALGAGIDKDHAHSLVDSGPSDLLSKFGVDTNK